MLHRRLAALEKQGKPIRVGLVGCGRMGVVYTVTAGDEPGVLGGMFEWAASIGLDVVAAVKGCMRPIDWNANATTLADEAAKLGLNPKMLASFRDGSKHNVEICVVANGT